MSQPSFIWHGPAQAVTLKDATGAVVWEGALTAGREVSGLPVDHPHVASWSALLWLVPAASPETPAADTPATEPVTRRRAKEG